MHRLPRDQIIKRKREITKGLQIFKITAEYKNCLCCLLFSETLSQHFEQLIKLEKEYTEIYKSLPDSVKRDFNTKNVVIDLETETPPPKIIEVQTVSQLQHLLTK